MSKSNADVLLHLIDQLKKRELMAATVRVGEVEVRLGSVIQPEEPEEDPSEAANREREQERVLAQSIYGAASGGWYPGAEQGN